jgi:hypothetical protein
MASQRKSASHGHGMPSNLRVHPKLSPLRRLLTILRVAQSSPSHALSLMAGFVSGQHTGWSHAAYLAGIISGALIRHRDPDALEHQIPEICEQFIRRAENLEPDQPIV